MSRPGDGKIRRAAEWEDWELAAAGRLLGAFVYETPTEVHTLTRRLLDTVRAEKAAAKTEAL